MVSPLGLRIFNSGSDSVTTGKTRGPWGFSLEKKVPSVASLPRFSEKDRRSGTKESVELGSHYRLDVQPDLFGEWCFVREWGRIGRPGQMRSVPYPTPAGSTRRARASAPGSRSGGGTFELKRGAQSHLATDKGVYFRLPLLFFPYARTDLRKSLILCPKISVSLCPTLDFDKACRSRNTR